MNNIKIIAEMAWSHDGSISKAIKIMKSAKEAGANYIGIHVTDMKSYMSIYYKSGPGKVSEEKESLNIYNYLNKINPSQNNWIKFKKVADKIKIKLCVMPNDIESFNFSKKILKPDMFALSAASFNEEKMIDKISKQKKDTVIRIGGATIKEIKNVLQIFKKNKNNKFILLHGIQVYPTSSKDVNLRQLVTLKKMFKCKLGIADHIDGSDDFSIFLPSLALPYGIEAIEKHITLDRKEKSEDFESALDPINFKKMVNTIKLSLQSMGKNKFEKLSIAERKYRQVSRKRSVGKQNIQKGEIISEKNVTFKRSDLGIDPLKIKEFFGKKSKKYIYKDCPIIENNLL